MLLAAEFVLSDLLQHLGDRLNDLINLVLLDDERR